MARWTINDAENKHLSDIIGQIDASIGLHNATIVLKDGRRITGKIVKKNTVKKQETKGPERSWATVTVDHDIGTFDLDLLNVSKVIPGHLK